MPGSFDGCLVQFRGAGTLVDMDLGRLAAREHADAHEDRSFMLPAQGS